MSVSLVESGAALQSMRNSDFDVHSAYGEVLDKRIHIHAPFAAPDLRQEKN